jgi:alpha-tubulin suppressor-like RCC1 family protein/predicted small lipoprotein YifL
MRRSVPQPVVPSIPAGKSVTTSILAALGAVLALAACGSTGPDTFDPATTVMTVGRPLLLAGDTVAVTLQTRDATGQPLVIDGATVVFSAQGGSSVGAFLPVVDHQDGTYSANFVGATPGTALTITAQVDGEPIASALPTLRVVGFTRIAAAGTIILDPDSGSGGFTCGIITTGDMYCWGLARHGIRGDGHEGGDQGEGVIIPGFEPTLVAGGHQWTDVAAANGHVCAVASTGVIYCWGAGLNGQLGNGLSGDSIFFVPFLTPAPVSGDGTFRTGATSSSNGTCAITLASTAMCWGAGTWGRLGNGSDTLSAVPVAVDGGLTFDALSTADVGTCGVATGGGAYCWGGKGLLGIGDAPAPDTCGKSGNGGTGGDILCAKEPIAVSGGHSFRPILASTDHTVCAAATDDQTYCWGLGYLGNGTKLIFASEPVMVSGGLSFVSLTAAGVSFDAGNEYHCGTVASGVAYCWGANRSGQLGNGTTTEALVPVAVSGDNTFSQLSAGEEHACGVRTDGNAYCWGANHMGELGTRTATASLTPARVRLFAP